jgi:DNA-binding NarL/FixJ family response regulator
MTPIRVLLADDHALFRRGVASLLAADRDFEVVGEAVDGQQAVEMARKLMPDVILMDISMPGTDGLEATRRIKAEMPYVRIVILTVSDGERSLFEAVKNGAQGYLLKKIEPQALYATLRGVVQGEATLSRVMAAAARGVRAPIPAARPRGGARRPADREGEGSSRARGPGQEQQGDRDGAGDCREHRQEPPQEHPREAPPREPRAGRHLRFARGDAREAARRPSLTRGPPKGPFPHGPSWRAR